MTSLVSEIVDSDQPAGNSDKLLTQVFSVLTAQFDAVASSVGVWAVVGVQTGQFESVASSVGVWAVVGVLTGQFESVASSVGVWVVVGVLTRQLCGCLDSCRRSNW